MTDGAPARSPYGRSRAPPPRRRRLDLTGPELTARPEQPDLARLPLQLDRGSRLPLNCVCTQLTARFFGDEKLVVGRARRRLDPRRRVHGVADDGEVEPAAPADRAH